MPNIGAKYGRKATWIGASGDQTFLRIDEALINSHVLATSEIFASKHIIGLVPSSVSEPPPFKCLLINKTDGSCRTFNDSEQEDLQGFGLCLDPVYDVIWRSVQGPYSKNGIKTFDLDAVLKVKFFFPLKIPASFQGDVVLQCSDRRRQDAFSDRLTRSL